MKKRMLAALLALCLTVGLALPVYAEAEPAPVARSGTVEYPVEGGNLYFNPETGEVTGCDKTITRADIPSVIDVVPVTGIGEYAFSECGGLTSVTIPDSVTSIEINAFYRCNGLTKIEVSTENPAYSVIDDVLFNKNGGILLLYPKGKEGDYSIPSGVTSIGAAAFKDCSGLTSVTIPDSVANIGKNAFYGCSSLTSVTIPDSVTSIGAGAFEYCDSLTSMTIPNSVTSIEGLVFSSCSSLTSVVIPDRVTSIGYSAFSGCRSLTSVTIPNSVTSIGDWAFSVCDNLTDVYYSGSELRWNDILIGSYNDPLTYAVIHCNSDSGSDGPLDSVNAKLISSSSDLSTVRLTGGTLPDDAQIYAARQAGGWFAGAAKGTVSEDQATFNCLLAEGDKLFFLSPEFIPLAPAVWITA